MTNHTIEQVFEHWNDVKPVWLSMNGEKWEEYTKYGGCHRLNYDSDDEWSVGSNKFYPYVSLTDPNINLMSREEMIVACYDMYEKYDNDFMVRCKGSSWHKDWWGFVFEEANLHFFEWTIDGGKTAHRFEKPKAEQ